MRNGPKVTYLYYYGGAKGQTLKLTELANGTILQEIVQTQQSTQKPTDKPEPSELEMPPLPPRPIVGSGFQENIKNLHAAALKILTLQEEGKKRGLLTKDEQLAYKQNLETLDSSAANLAARVQDEDELLDQSQNNEETSGAANVKIGLESWFDRKRQNQKGKDEKNKKKEENRKEEEDREDEEDDDEDKKKKEAERRRKEQEKREEEKRKEQEKRKEEEEENKTKMPDKEAGEENVGENNHETVEINLPPDDASVAEAKPVGLAIAGAGGVAASKPIATAVVGPAGLAIARPVGTAIAGVSPDQALVPIFAEAEDGTPSKKETIKAQNKEKRKKLTASEYLNRIISRYHQV